MRLISGTFLLALTAGAHAHTLAGDESLVVRLGHQLLGSHHLPLTILLVIVGVIAVRHARNSLRHVRNSLRHVRKTSRHDRRIR